jgi:hypothetical protein
MCLHEETALWQQAAGCSWDLLSCGGVCCWPKPRSPAGKLFATVSLSWSVCQAWHTSNLCSKCTTYCDSPTCPGRFPKAAAERRLSLGCWLLSEGMFAAVLLIVLCTWSSRSDRQCLCSSTYSQLVLSTCLHLFIRMVIVLKFHVMHVPEGRLVLRHSYQFTSGSINIQMALQCAAGAWLTQAVCCRRPSS